MILRPYQSKGKDSTFLAWETSRTALGVMPTGCGKTVLFASIIKKFLPRRTMVIAHRQELIWQARDKIQKVAGVQVDVEMGEYKSRLDRDLLSPIAPVIVSTVQTHIAGGDGAGRIGKFNPDDFELLVIDEAHHATTASYRRIIDYYLTNPKLKVLGVTATPDRADEQALGQVFETVAFDYEIIDAIREGWLVPIEQQIVSVEDLDFSNIRTQGGDLSGADLDAVMRGEKPLYGVASSTIQIVGNKQGIGFASSVEHARILCDMFNRPKYNFPGKCGFVHAGTPPEERRLIISEFAKGKIQFLWNCGVFTEGFDESNIAVISMARPTKSRSLYAQMAGRATRPHESIAHTLNNFSVDAIRRSFIARSCKPSCLIIDFVGNSGKHKLVTTADILGGNISDEAIQSAVQVAKKSGKPIKMRELLEDEEKKIAEQNKRKLKESARKARIVVNAKFKTQAIDPFDVLDVKPNKPRGWDTDKVLSEPQCKVLRNAGYDPHSFEFARAKQLVGMIIERRRNKKCTIKQAATLEKCGWSKAEASAMGFEQASSALDAAAKNGWKKPALFKPENLRPIPKRVAEDDIPF